MAASEIIWEKSRDGFLFHRYSRPEILEQLFRKIRENSREKICVGALFLVLATKTLYYSFLAISDISEKLFQETPSEAAS